LEDLELEVLSPQHSAVRTQLPAEFPSNSSTKGTESWFLLEGLGEGQRYEIRICWAATQPAAFHLYPHELQTVFETPELITSLAAYSESRRAASDGTVKAKESVTKNSRQLDGLSSALFLQIFSAADYYSWNQTLMQDVPPVWVDVILDPYVFNVFPRSLIPTAGYLTLVAIGSWFLSKYISDWVRTVARDEEHKKID